LNSRLPHGSLHLRLKLVSTWTVLRGCLIAAILIISIKADSSAAVPECPSERSITSTLRDETATLRIPTDISLLYRPLNSPALVIEAGFDAKGSLTCASPFSGLSPYWPAAIAVLSAGQSLRTSASGFSEIVAFEDPARPAVRRAWDLGRSAQRCRVSLGLETMLQLGAGQIFMKRPQEAAACFDLALHIDPNSVSANYGAAIAAGLLGDSRSRIGHYEKTVLLSPRFYEARLDLASAQQFTVGGETAVVTLQGILADSPPLPIRRRVYDALVSVYDRAKRRRDAAGAKRSLVMTESEGRRRAPTLVDAALITFDTSNLAACEEEIGDYEHAAQDFAEAVRLSNVPNLSGAVRYEADLGRIRSIRKLGQDEPARKDCADWLGRLSDAGNELEDQNWGGKTISLARWEFSCGDFDKATKLLRSERQRKPNSDAPYLVLERAYRARGESDLGDKAHVLAERIRTAHDQAILRAILSEAEDLSKQGAGPHIP